MLDTQSMARPSKFSLSEAISSGARSSSTSLLRPDVAFAIVQPGPTLDGIASALGLEEGYARLRSRADDEAPRGG